MYFQLPELVTCSYNVKCSTKDTMLVTVVAPYGCLRSILLWTSACASIRVVGFCKVIDDFTASSALARALMKSSRSCSFWSSTPGLWSCHCFWLSDPVSAQSHEPLLDPILECYSLALLMQPRFHENTPKASLGLFHLRISKWGSSTQHWDACL